MDAFIHKVLIGQSCTLHITNEGIGVVNSCVSRAASAGEVLASELTVERHVSMHIRFVLIDIPHRSANVHTKFQSMRTFRQRQGVYILELLRVLLLRQESGEPRKT